MLELIWRCVWAVCESAACRTARGLGSLAAVGTEWLGCFSRFGSLMFFTYGVIFLLKKAQTNSFFKSLAYVNTTWLIASLKEKNFVIYTTNLLINYLKWRCPLKIKTRNWRLYEKYMSRQTSYNSITYPICLFIKLFVSHIRSYKFGEIILFQHTLMLRLNILNEMKSCYQWIFIIFRFNFVTIKFYLSLIQFYLGLIELYFVRSNFCPRTKQTLFKLFLFT